MTNEEIRIKIAESLNWRLWNTVWTEQGKDKVLGWTSEMRELHQPAKPLPNYPESLDACSELESSLIDKEFDAYQIELSRIVFNYPCFVTFPVGFSHRKFWQATPLQRCLAYIQVKNL